MDQTADYTSPNIGSATAILGVTFTLTMAMIAVVVARPFARIAGGVRLVDWAHLLACLLSAAVSITAVIGVRYCVGRRIFDTTASDTVNGLKAYWIARIFHIVATWVIKMAILAPLLLASSAAPQHVRGRLKVLIFGAMAFMTVYTVVFWIGAVVECSPMSMRTPNTREGQCFPRNSARGMANGYAAVNAATDLSVVVFSLLVIVYGVKRSMREKVALGVVFTLAFLATCAACIHALCEFRFGKTGHFTYDNNSPAIWAIVEINIGLIAANLPALSPLFHSLLRPHGPPTGDSSPPSNYPTSSASTPVMASVNKALPERPESQQNIHVVDVHPPMTLPQAPPPAVQSTHRFRSESKSSLSSIMTMQLDVDIENHPIFREQTIPRTGVEYRAPTPLMF